MTKEQAIQFLDDQGFYVQNLFHISDVQDRFDCTNEEAQDILHTVLTSDGIVESVFEGIDMLGRFNRFKEAQ